VWQSEELLESFFHKNPLSVSKKKFQVERMQKFAPKKNTTWSLAGVD
jgi:hypothetical protein